MDRDEFEARLDELVEEARDADVHEVDIEEVLSAKRKHISAKRWGNA